MFSGYRNLKILVTGGLGFIGSNLVLRLVEAGADVTVVDSCVMNCGANRHNIAPAGSAVRVAIADIGQAADFAAEIRGCSAIFNLAGEISHIHSMQDPCRDAELNAIAQLRFLEVCARQAPGVRVVYAGTRQIYGVPRYLPVDERHPIQPVDFNGIHKYAAMAYHLLFTSTGRLDALTLCLTNVYGPRMALHIGGQGFLGNFLRRALQGEPIEVFGDGSQLRDPVYVDDVVDAFLLAGLARDPVSRVWNVGGRKALSLAEIAAKIGAIGEAPPPVFRPFPDTHKSIDIGSYCTDSSKIRRELGWLPRVGFERGVRRSLDFFRSNLRDYLDAADCPAEAPALWPSALPAPVPAMLDSLI